MDYLDRSELMLGKERVERLKNKKVILFGVGGVGSFTLEALVRAGIGEVTIVDKDIIDRTNINRQLIALHSNIGEDKVTVAKERMLDINPELKIHAVKTEYSEENKDQFNLAEYDFVIDAIDSVPAKIALIKESKERDVPIISSMGMGNKIHPEMIEIIDIKKTVMDPLAKKIRIALKKEGITSLPVVFSKEEPVVRTIPPGSISTVPSTAGLIIASYVLNHLMEM